MKKWSVITGILALLLIISMGTCSSNSAEVDRLKTEVAELSSVKTELDELQTSYNTLLSEYNKFQAQTSILPEETGTSPSETRIENLPYSWTEGVVVYTIELLKGEGYWGADSWDFYEVQVSYKNASHEMTEWRLDVGGFKLRTDASNVYGLEDGGLHASELAPKEESDGFVAVVFKVHKGEVPTELWWYRQGEDQEKPDIIFRLELDES